MIEFFDELKLVSVAIALTLGACGGGDTAAVSTPAPEVFTTMLRNISYGTFDGGVRILDDDPTTVIVAVINAGIRVRAIRCASLSPPRDVPSVQVQTPVLFMDVAADDVEKLKTFKFRVFGPSDQRGVITPEVCL